MVSLIGRIGHTLTRHLPRARKIPSCSRSYVTRGQCRANSPTAPGPVYSVISTDPPLSLRRNPAAICSRPPPARYYNGPLDATGRVQNLADLGNH